MTGFITVWATDISIFNPFPARLKIQSHPIFSLNLTRDIIRRGYIPIINWLGLFPARNQSLWRRASVSGSIGQWVHTSPEFAERYAHGSFSVISFHCPHLISMLSLSAYAMDSMVGLCTESVTCRLISLFIGIWTPLGSQKQPDRSETVLIFMLSM